MITNKAFSHYDACGTCGFTYDAEGNDITPNEKLQKIHAVYDVQVDGGPWKKSWCTVATHQAGVDADIETELEANYG